MLRAPSPFPCNLRLKASVLIRMIGLEVLRFHFFVDPDPDPEPHPKELELESLGSMLESDPPLELAPTIIDTRPMAKIINYRWANGLAARQIRDQAYFNASDQKHWNNS